jgi:hypothetical protein
MSKTETQYQARHFIATPISSVSVILPALFTPKKGKIRKSISYSSAVKVINSGG